MQGLGERIVVNLDVPQTVINFGSPGLARHDPDFFAAYVVNHIYGGGSMTSRLYHEVREKRGLAYGIRTSLIWMDHASIVTGGTATRGDRAAETLSLIEQEITAHGAPKARRRTSSTRRRPISRDPTRSPSTPRPRSPGNWCSFQLDKLGIDYPERRNAMIDAVTLDDAKRVAKAAARHQDADRWWSAARRA